MIFTPDTLVGVRQFLCGDRFDAYERTARVTILGFFGDREGSTDLQPRPLPAPDKKKICKN